VATQNATEKKIIEARVTKFGTDDTWCWRGTVMCSWSRDQSRTRPENVLFIWLSAH